MNTTMMRIDVLRARLNDLMKNSELCTEPTSEIYSLSQQLDELIVAYYKEATQQNTKDKLRLEVSDFFCQKYKNSLKNQPKSNRIKESGVKWFEVGVKGEEVEDVYR